MKRQDILRRLEERLARGEISEKTFLEIKARYESEPEELEVPEEPVSPMEDLGAKIGAAVAEATSQASRAAEEAVRVVDEVTREVTRGAEGIGRPLWTKVSDEAIRIVGTGSVSGNPVKTTEFRSAGRARVQGSLVAESAKVAGSSSFEGDVTVEEFRSAGSHRIAGNLKAESVVTSGAFEVAGSIEAEEISTSGSVRVQGSVEAEQIRSEGNFAVEGSVVSEHFRSGGAVHIGGGLKAEEIEIDLYGPSKIPTIEGESIRVKATGGFARLRGDLTADRIEGEDVTLEATTAAFVKGEHVTIGPHCRIDVVEADNLTVHQSSEVRERRTGPSEEPQPISEP